jgi:hypothetical protein
VSLNGTFGEIGSLRVFVHIKSQQALLLIIFASNNSTGNQLKIVGLLALKLRSNLLIGD